MTQELQTAPTNLLPEPASTVNPAISPHIQFRQVRDRLLEIEQDQQAGRKVNLAEVQELVNKAADLTAKMQTSSTGPKKPKDTSPEGGKKKPAKEKKASSIAHLNIPDGDDF